jgi:signal transduction histidine kinase
MKTRARLISAHFEIGRNPEGRGTVVRVLLPAGTAILEKP